MKTATATFVVLMLTTTSVLGQDENTVFYRLGLDGTYTPVPLDPDPIFPSPCALLSPVGEECAYIHGDETPGQVFNRDVTPQIRWDAIVVVTGPNFGAANLVINLQVHVGSVDGPVATAANFTGDYYEGCQVVPANFSIGSTYSFLTCFCNPAAFAPTPVSMSYT